MKKITLQIILFYKKIVSPVLVVMFGKACRFTPTCSEYAFEAVNRYGSIKGSRLAINRFLRCQPFSKSYFDPLPHH